MQKNTYRVPKMLSGERADKIVRKALALKGKKEGTQVYPSRQKLLKLFAQGLVHFEGAPVEASRRLNAGNILTFLPEPAREKKQAKVCKTALPELLFENEYFFVFNKPAGLSMHGGGGVRETEYTFADYLLSKYPYLRDVGEDETRPGIVHRLDKDTSGVVLVARANDAYDELKYLFTERMIQKQYLALVEGHLRENAGVITFSLKRSKNSLKRVPVKKKEDETEENPLVKDAVTEYQEVVRFKETSLVSLLPKTGRMHQIRVHLKALGHPILGDQLYGTKKIHLDYPHIQRQMLHASRLDFDLFGTKYLFQAHLPEDFVQALKSLDGFAESGYDYEALEGLLPNEVAK